MASSTSWQDESNPLLWLATQAGKMELPCLLRTTRCVPQGKFPQKPYNKSFIDQACSVKMAGYWPRSFFASLWTLTPSRSINTQKKNLANIQPSWPHTWSITHTSYPLRTTCCVLQEKFPQKPYNKSFIDQACSVKMAGYWPCSFFASLWTWTLSRSINTHKKNLVNIQPSWPHAWSITHIQGSHLRPGTGQINWLWGQFCPAGFTI